MDSNEQVNKMLQVGEEKWSAAVIERKIPGSVFLAAITTSIAIMLDDPIGDEVMKAADVLVQTYMGNGPDLNEPQS